MTSVAYEAVRELAAATGVDCERKADDTGLPAGEVFVNGELVVATIPCFVANVSGKPFKDYTSAVVYIKILCVAGGD